MNEGSTVTLAGKGSDPEGQPLTYAWTAPSGITLSSTTKARPTFTAPDREAEYTLTFSLVVNDGTSDSAPDTVDISVTVDNSDDEQNDDEQNNDQQNVEQNNGAQDGGGEGQGGDPDPERPPTAPRNLSLTPGNGIIKVSWSAPQDMGNPDDWIGYVVESRWVGVEDEWYEEGLYQGTSATILYLYNGAEYEVRVIAVNMYGQAIAGPKRATPTAE